MTREHVMSGGGDGGRDAELNAFCQLGKPTDLYVF